MDDTRETIQWLKSIKEKYIHGGDDDYDDKRRQALDEAIRMLGLLANGVTAQRWIPVAERLPEDRAEVLCWYEYFRYGGYNRMHETFGIGYQFNGNWGGEVSNGAKTRVLYWMPLPEPPKEE